MCLVAFFCLSVFNRMGFQPDNDDDNDDDDDDDDEDDNSDKTSTAIM